MPPADPFTGAFERPEQLREFYDGPMEVAVRKDIGHIDELCRRLIAAAPMLFVATFSSEGHADVSPRGGQPGFVTVLDDAHLAIPDATGNRRLDTLENVVSSAERRALLVDEEEIVPRIADIYGALSAITGKIELEYEGELVGGHAIARELIRRAADATFKARADGVNTDDVVMFFDAGGALQVTDDLSAAAVAKGFEAVPGLIPIVRAVGLAPNGDVPLTAAACELVLESLVARKKISRTDGGQYGRAVNEPRRRPNQDLFGGGMSA